MLVPEELPEDFIPTEPEYGEGESDGYASLSVTIDHLIIAFNAFFMYLPITIMSPFNFEN